MTLSTIQSELKKLEQFMEYSHKLDQKLDLGLLEPCEYIIAKRKLEGQYNITYELSRPSHWLF